MKLPLRSLHTRSGTILVIVLSVILSLTAIVYSYQNKLLLAYGDAESHLNISKRITHSLTPGLAQLGGIWLPLPHLLMVPFTNIEWMYRTGLAGSVISSIAFVIGSIYLYKITLLLTRRKLAAFVAFLVFALNPNILYLQTTAMTEILLIAFFMGSIYYFLKYLEKPDLLSLIGSAAFGLGATLSRYDGWFLVLAETGLLTLYHISRFPWQDLLRRTHHTREFWKRSVKRYWYETEGYIILFSFIAFTGMALWVVWDWLILGDPLYFTNSPFSAKSQQQSWLANGELPAYRDLGASFTYYLTTAKENAGVVVSLAAAAGLGLYLLWQRRRWSTLAASALLLTPFYFYVMTLYMGQSVIFIPSLTPDTFEWTLFNVRYGIMMVPTAAIFCAVLLQLVLPRKLSFGTLREKLLTPLRVAGSILLLMLLGLQTVRFFTGKESAVSIDDGVRGLSSAKQTDALNWVRREYDDGLILMDDYARTLSVIRSGLPMENVIYVGTKPYWEESLKEPEKYAKWIIMQKDDTVWRTLYEDPGMQGRLYAHFEKAYTSPTILVFKRQADQVGSSTPSATIASQTETK